MVPDLSIFSFADLSFFCRSECIYILTWERIYRSLLISAVHLLPQPQYTVTLLILYTYSYSLTPSVVRSYNVHHAADLSCSSTLSQFSHAVALRANYHWYRHNLV
jgi:hypothetical protein